MSLPSLAEVHALHRYFLWADQMREHYYQALDAGLAADVESAAKAFRVPYMSYWYGGLYVVIEGWWALGLSDDEIDRLLESPHVTALKRYRNGSFHFQRKYFDARFIGFLSGDGSAEWIFNLRQAFSRWFLEYFKRHQPAATN